MAPVAGRPFLAWVLDRLVEAGFESAVLAVGYRHEAIREHFGERYRGLVLHYSGGGDAARTGAPSSRRGLRAERPVFVLNGIPTWTGLLRHAGRASAGSGSLSVAVCSGARCQPLRCAGTGGGTSPWLLEKGRAGPGFINAGVYLLSYRTSCSRFPLANPFPSSSNCWFPASVNCCHWHSTPGTIHRHRHPRRLRARPAVVTQGTLD